MDIQSILNGMKHDPREALYEIISDMKSKNEESREIAGIGTIYYKRDGEIPYMLFVPNEIDENQRLVVEANNSESPKYNEVENQASNTIFKGARILNGKAPVLVPIIPPSFEEPYPYYQQLSVNAQPLQVADSLSEIIKEALSIIETEKNVKLDDKVFMMGYSSSGVFAQRFALLHPELIDTLVVGGATTSIPVLDETIPYPLGIGGIEGFREEDYKKIRFRYYVGQLEEIVKSTLKGDEIDKDDRYDVVVDNDGKMKVDRKEGLPLHDMTYFPRSVHPYVGYLYRLTYGQDMFTRENNITNKYMQDGCDFESKIIADKAHKDVKIDGILKEGVKNLEDPIISRAYQESTASLTNNKTK